MERYERMPMFSKTTSEKRRALTADATLVAVAFIWGLGIPLSADLIRAMTPIWGSAVRMGLAGMVILAIHPKKALRASRIEWKYGVMLAVLVSLIYTLMGFALIYSTASKQAFIIGTSVLMVPFMAWGVSRVRPHGLVFLGAAMATVGMLVMGFSPGMLFNYGDFLNILMCILYASMVIVIEYMVKRAEPTTLVVIQLPLVGVMMAATALLFEGPIDLFSLSLKLWAEIVFLGIFNTVLCFVMQTRAQKSTSASHAAIILSLESLFGYMISVLSGQDPFVLQGAIGGLVIFFGVLTSEMEIFLKKSTVRDEDD